MPRARSTRPCPLRASSDRGAAAKHPFGVSPRGPSSPQISDALFVARKLAARTARYFDAQGDSQRTNGHPCGARSGHGVAASGDASADEAGGPGVGSGAATRRAPTGRSRQRVHGRRGAALRLSLLLDTILLMPEKRYRSGVVRVKGGGAGAARRWWFRAPANRYFALDSATGADPSARVARPARPLYAFAATATDTVADSCATKSFPSTDTNGRKERALFPFCGTVIRRAAQCPPP